ncbi:hypothetical protein [Thermovibrio ammonificans]
MSLQRKRLDWKSIARVKVFSFWEILAFVVFVLFVAYLLFPKGKIEEFFVEDPNYNYPLAKYYVESVLAHSKSPRLVFTLVEKNLSVGEFGRAYDLLNRYAGILNAPGYRDKFFALKLKALLGLYSTARPAEKELYREKVVALLKKLLNSGGVSSLEAVYSTALTIGALDVAESAAYKLALLTGEERWLRKAIDLAWAEGDTSTLKGLLELCLSRCRLSDADLKKFFTVALQIKDEKLYTEVARRLIDRGVFTYQDLKKLIDVELAKRNYRGALDFCRVFLKRNGSFKVLKECLNLAMWSGNRGVVEELIRENLGRYTSKDALSFFLKVAVAQNLRRLSVELADRLLKQYGGEK